MVYRFGILRICAINCIPGQWPIGKNVRNWAASLPTAWEHLTFALLFPTMQEDSFFVLSLHSTATTITFEVHRHSSSPLTSYYHCHCITATKNISPVDCASKMYAAHRNQETVREQALLEHSKRKRKAALSWEDRIYESEYEVLDAMVSSCCPHCATAFADFSGCAALQCGTCMKFFCGLCGCVTPDDGHNHVLNCPSRSFFKMNGVFLRIEDWHRGRALMINLQMAAHLSTLPNSLEAVRKRLRDTFRQNEGTQDDPDFPLSPLYEASPADLPTDDELSPAHDARDDDRAE